jgi:hypothetical protein
MWRMDSQATRIIKLNEIKEVWCFGARGRGV